MVLFYRYIHNPFLFLLSLRMPLTWNIDSSVCLLLSVEEGVKTWS